MNIYTADQVKYNINAHYILLNYLNSVIVLVHILTVIMSTNFSCSVNAIKVKCRSMTHYYSAAVSFITFMARLCPLRQ